MESGPGRPRSALAHRILCNRVRCSDDLFWLPIAQYADAASIVVEIRQFTPRAAMITRSGGPAPERLKQGLIAVWSPVRRAELALRLPKAGRAMLRFFCGRYDLVRSVGRLILR